MLGGAPRFRSPDPRRRRPRIMFYAPDERQKRDAERDDAQQNNPAHRRYVDDDGGGVRRADHNLGFVASADAIAACVSDPAHPSTRRPNFVCNCSTAARVFGP